MRPVNRDAAAAAHDNSSHEGYIGLGVAGNRVVENVLDPVDFVHEGIVAAMLVHGTHVATRAKCPFAGTAHKDSRDRRSARQVSRRACNALINVMSMTLRTAGRLSMAMPTEPAT